jgi:hypothetical protein
VPTTRIALADAPAAGGAPVQLRMTIPVVSSQPPPSAFRSEGEVPAVKPIATTPRPGWTEKKP